MNTLKKVIPSVLIMLKYCHKQLALLAVYLSSISSGKNSHLMDTVLSLFLTGQLQALTANLIIAMLPVE